MSSTIIRSSTSSCRRFWSAVVLLVLMPGVAGAAPATAAEPNGPAIVSPSSGENVQGYVEVTAISSAPRVLISWASEAEDRKSAYDYTNVVDGQATVTLTSSGYNGLTEIMAQDCREVVNPSAPGWSSTVCDGPQTSVEVNVTNPMPIYSAFNYSGERHGDFAVSVDEEESWAYYGWFVDGVYQPPVDNSRGFIVSTDLLEDGVHTLQAAHCTALSHDRFDRPPVCDMTNASEIESFTLRTALHPVISAVTPRTISPDANGVADQAVVEITVETDHFLTWTLQRNAQVAAGGSENMAAGPQTFIVDGLDSAGKPLPSGDYTLVVETWTNSGSGTEITGTVSTDMKIDLNAPQVTAVATSPRVFYPKRDGYRDNVTLAGSLSEGTSATKIQLLREGAVRRTLRLGPLEAGSFTTLWDGRRLDGTMMPAGIYQYRFVVTDRVGNTATRAGQWIDLRRGA